MIYLIILWLLISEIVYIFFCKEETKKRIRKLWFFSKIMALILSGIGTLLLYGIYLVAKDYPLYLSIGIGGILAIIIYFYLNKKLALAVSK